MMMQVFKDWYERYFSDPEAVYLFVYLIGISVVIWLFGDILMPILASIVIAYVLDWIVVRLEKQGVPRSVGIGSVFLVFIGLVTVLTLWVVPLLARETASLFNQLPLMIASGQQTLNLLPERYPEFISQAQINDLTAIARTQVGELGQHVLSYSLASIMTIVTIIVYMVVVPLVVFFFLKDRDQILKWTVSFLPEKRDLLKRVWHEVDDQMGNYLFIICIGGNFNFYPLYRGNCGHCSYRRCCIFPMGVYSHFRLVNCCLFCNTAD